MLNRRRRKEKREKREAAHKEECFKNIIFYQFIPWSQEGSLV
jgi:hypothetical protein